MSFPADVELNAAVVADVDAAVAADPNLILLGYSVRESKSAEAVATIVIVNGATGAAAGKLVHIELAASTSETVWLGDRGIHCPLGLSIDWITGEVDISLYYKVLV